MVIVKRNMTGYDYRCGYEGNGKFGDPVLREDVYVDEGRTDEPRSLPHFSSLLIKVSMSKCCTDSEESHDIRIQN